MPRHACSCLAAVATLSLALHVGALPRASVAPHIYAGLFGKVRLPHINVAKGIKAVAYPVTKTTVNGGKDAISGGETAVKVYGTWKSLSSKTNGIPAIARLK